MKGKALVMLVVLNRVWSDEFPDTIEEVIFQKNQFSPVANGRYDAVEPDEECYEALKLLQTLLRTTSITSAFPFTPSLSASAIAILHSR